MALPCPGSSKSMIVAKTVLTLSWTMLSHSRIIRTCDYSWDGAYIVMDDALWNRLQTYACCTPITPKSRTVAETILTLSCIMLFAIACKRTRNPFQDHNKFEIMIMTEMLLTLSWAMQCIFFAKVRMTRPGTIKIYDCGWDSASLSWTMRFEIACKHTRCPLQNHHNLWL